MTLSVTEPGHLSQQQLESTLWTAANALRGPVDPGDFKAYVFPILFFKWISDNWDWEHAQAVEDFGDALTDELESGLHTFMVPEGCHWADVMGTAQHTGAKLDEVLQRLQTANPDSLRGVFGDVQWANTDRLPQSALMALLNTFHSMRLDPDSVNGDMLGSAYEYLLREFAEASGKKAGEFFTPRHVVHLLVKLLDPQPGDEIADPACGSGGMLVETVSAVRRDGGNPNTLRLYGQEINLTTSAIAKMNLYLHDLEDFTIVRGDTFREPKLLDGDGLKKFDIVIANPPFILQNWGAEVWPSDPFGRSKYGVPPAGNGDFAWIEHMLASMKESTGRVGVVMSHGVLTRGETEAKIRQAILEDDLLEAVVDLPSKLFYSTTLPVCLLIFRAKKRLERSGHVVFVDASQQSKVDKTRNTMTDAQVDAIAAAFHQADTSTSSVEEVPCRSVPVSEIAANNWQLNVGAYISRSANASRDIEVTNDRVLASVATAAFDLAANLKALEELLASFTEGGGLSLGEQFQKAQLGDFLTRSREAIPVEDGVTYPCVGLLRDGMGVLDRDPFIGGETTYKKLSVVREGQVVYRTITAFEAPIAVVPKERDGFHVSGVFPVFNIDHQMASSDFLKWVIRWKPMHQEMADRCKGTVLRRKTLSVEDFLNIEVPLPSKDKQQAIAAFLNTVAIATAAGLEGEALLQDVMSVVLTHDAIPDGGKRGANGA